MQPIYKFCKRTCSRFTNQANTCSSSTNFANRFTSVRRGTGHQCRSTNASSKPTWKADGGCGSRYVPSTCVPTKTEDAHNRQEDRRETRQEHLQNVHPSSHPSVPALTRRGSVCRMPTGQRGRLLILCYATLERELDSLNGLLASSKLTRKTNFGTTEHGAAFYS